LIETFHAGPITHNHTRRHRPHHLCFETAQKHIFPTATHNLPFSRTIRSFFYFFFSVKPDRTLLSLSLTWCKLQCVKICHSLKIVKKEKHPNSILNHHCFSLALSNILHASLQSFQLSNKRQSFSQVLHWVRTQKSSHDNYSAPKPLHRNFLQGFLLKITRKYSVYFLVIAVAFQIIFRIEMHIKKLNFLGTRFAPRSQTYF